MKQTRRHRNGQENRREREMRLKRELKMRRFLAEQADVWLPAKKVGVVAAVKSEFEQLMEVTEVLVGNLLKEMRIPAYLVSQEGREGSSWRDAALTLKRLDGR